MRGYMVLSEHPSGTETQRDYAEPSDSKRHLAHHCIDGTLAGRRRTTSRVLTVLPVLSAFLRAADLNIYLVDVERGQGHVSCSVLRTIAPDRDWHSRRRRPGP